MVKVTNKEKMDNARKKFEEIAKQIRNKKEWSSSDLLKLKNFKPKKNFLDSEEKIKEITRKAFKLAKRDKTEDAIKELCNINGVTISIASFILTIKFPERYVPFDVITINELRKKKCFKQNDIPKDTINSEDYPFFGYLSHYLEYIELMRKKAKEKGIKLEDLEREKWEKRTK